MKISFHIEESDYDCVFGNWHPVKKNKGFFLKRILVGLSEDRYSQILGVYVSLGSSKTRIREFL